MKLAHKKKKNCTLIGTGYDSHWVCKFATVLLCTLTHFFIWMGQEKGNDERNARLIGRNIAHKTEMESIFI